MFAHELVRNAWLAGTFVALGCGAIGWFVVMRAQVFAGDALGHATFVGAIAAATLGVDERLGLFAAALGLAAAIGALGRRAGADDATIGIVLAWVLGIGALLLAVLATSPAAAGGIIAANSLFGSIYTLSAGQAVVAAAVAVVALAAVLAIARPLLLASLDSELAVSRGIRVGLLGIVFLVALAGLTAEATQSVGALLVLGLLASPAGAARRLTSRPHLGVALSGGIALGAMWGGLALSYVIAALPPSTAIVGIAAAAYAAAAVVTAPWAVARRPWSQRSVRAGARR